MPLADFIRLKTELIVDESERFARTVASLGSETDVSKLRDHLPLVLKAIALDLEQPQTPAQQERKSEGLGPTLRGETAAQAHGRLRADSGLSTEEVVAEYRVLRASVLRLWEEDGGLGEPGATADLIRFNEALDQAIAESVIVYSDKMDHWRETLLAVIGHDLRSPLHALKLTTQSLQRRKDPSLQTETDRLARGIDHIAHLLDALLDYNRAKLGVGMQVSPRRADLAITCREEVEQLQAALPRVLVRFEASGDTVGHFDVVRVREALGNIVSNAHQYRTPGTDISVRVEGHEEDVLLSVSNEGPDIEPNALSRLFEPFQRNKEGAQVSNKRNLGLGLFVVREIARAHGGEAKAISADGRVVIELRLPKESTP